MKTLFALALLLPPNVAYAKTAEWYCTTQASDYAADRILACGVGEAATEGAARVDALEAAKTEFLGVCQAPNCADWAFRPKRTQCNPENGVWKCLRAVEFSPSLQSRALAAGVTPGRSWAILSEITGAPGGLTNFGVGLRGQMRLGWGFAVYTSFYGGQSTVGRGGQWYARSASGLALDLTDDTYARVGAGFFVPGVGPTLVAGEASLGAKLLTAGSVSVIVEGGLRAFGTREIRPGLAFGFSW